MGMSPLEQNEDYQARQFLRGSRVAVHLRHRIGEVDHEGKGEDWRVVGNLENWTPGYVFVRIGESHTMIIPASNVLAVEHYNDV